MSDRIKDELQRGALVNALGVLGKIAGPSFLILVTRFYGADTFGIYITASALVEMAIAFLTAGFKDGALIFVSRHAEDDRSLLYQALSNALAWSLLFAGLLIVVALAAAPWLVPRFYAYGDRLLPVLQWMTFVLPLMAFDRIVLAATQGLKIMKYEAFVNGGLRPVLLLISAIGFWFFLPNETGLTLAYVTTQCLVAGASLLIYQRELEWAPLVDAFRNFKYNREMVAFAIPQNLNATFDRFVTNVDIVMLGFFGISASTTGLYGAGSLIVRELRQIKLVFSSAFAPHIVRLYEKQDRARLAHMVAVTSRWITTLAVPALLGVAVLHADLLRIVSPEYAGAEGLFMLFLLPVPYLQCAFGLAGNVVVMTGHSRLNLFNSMTTASTNVALNTVLIPVFGPVGAAAASGLSALLKAGLELGEMRFLLNVGIRWREQYVPHVAGLIVAVALGLALNATPVFETHLGYRIGLAVAAMLGFGAVLTLLQGRLPRLPAPLQALLKKS